MFWSKLCESNRNCAWNLAFPVFISPIVWSMCEHVHYESVYFKELHNKQEYYWPTIYRAGAAVVSTLTSINTRDNNENQDLTTKPRKIIALSPHQFPPIVARLQIESQSTMTLWLYPRTYVQKFVRSKDNAVNLFQFLFLTRLVPLKWTLAWGSRPQK